MKMRAVNNNNNTPTPRKKKPNPHRIFSLTRHYNLVYYIPLERKRKFIQCRVLPNCFLNNSQQSHILLFLTLNPSTHFNFSPHKQEQHRHKAKAQSKPRGNIKREREKQMMCSGGGESEWWGDSMSVWMIKA
jgi:hypothetical protein